MFGMGGNVSERVSLACPAFCFVPHISNGDDPMTKHHGGVVEVFADDDPSPLEDDTEGLDAAAAADSFAPTKVKNHHCDKGNPAYRYFLSVRSQLADWWEEFRTELDPVTGGPKYRTVSQFARSKTKNEQEQRWIKGMIGSVPCVYGDPRTQKKVVYLKIPWLGDWKTKRSERYWAPDQPAKIKALARAIKEKLVAWDAIRSAAPLLVREMASYEKLSEQIDEAFAGQPFDLTKPLQENVTRFNTYFAMKTSVTQIKLRLMDQWMLVHGINPKDPVQMTQVNMTLGAQAEQPNERDLQAIKMVRMLQMHSETFKMPLPKFKSEQQVIEAEPAEPSVKTPNGKVM